MILHELMLFIPIISTDRALFGEIKTALRKTFTALSLENEMYVLYSKAETIAYISEMRDYIIASISEMTKTHINDCSGI